MNRFRKKKSIIALEKINRRKQWDTKNIKVCHSRWLEASEKWDGLLQTTAESLQLNVTPSWTRNSHQLSAQTGYRVETGWRVVYFIALKKVGERPIYHLSEQIVYLCDESNNLTQVYCWFYLKEIHLETRSHRNVFRVTVGEAIIKNSKIYLWALTGRK